MGPKNFGVEPRPLQEEGTKPPLPSSQVAKKHNFVFFIFLIRLFVWPEERFPKIRVVRNSHEERRAVGQARSRDARFQILAPDNAAKLHGAEVIFKNWRRRLRLVFCSSIWPKKKIAVLEYSQL